jgi:hypothetical protein
MLSQLFQNFAPALQKAEERQKAEEQNPLLGLVRGTNDVMQQYDEADKARNTPVPEAKQRTITPLEVLIGVVGGAIDPKAGQAFFAGLQHGISQENQRREASRQEALAKQEQMARTLEGRAARADARNQMIYKERVDTNEKREAAKGRLSAAQWKMLSMMSPEARVQYARVVLGQSDPVFLDSLATLTPSEAKSKSQGEEALSRGKLFDKQGWKIAMETPAHVYQMFGAGNASNAAAGLSKEKTITERDTRPLRLKKMDADIQNALSRVGVNKNTAELIVKKLASYDEEFKLRMAERAARIDKLQREPGALNTGRGIQALKDMMSIQKAQMDAIKDKYKGDVIKLMQSPGDWVRYQEIESQFKDTQQMLKGVRERDIADMRGPIGAAPINPANVAPTWNPVGKSGWSMKGG